MTVGSEQAVAHEKSGARDARANRRTLVGKADLVHAVNVTDGISVPVQHQRGHRLLFLEFRYLPGELGYLATQFIRLRALRSRGGVVVEHGHGSSQQHYSQRGLYHLLPALADLILFLRKLRCGHERPSSLVWKRFSTVRKMMYRGYRECLEDGSVPRWL